MISSKFNNYDVHLVENLDDLGVVRSLLDSKVSVGFDTETDGLDVHHTIAGVCIACGHNYSPGHYHGFYIPIRHIGYPNNLPIDTVMQFSQEIIDTYKTVWWNRDFDASMLEKDGIKFPTPGRTHDAQCMAHLVKGDPFPSLKDWVTQLLKFNVMHFEDNAAVNNNFKTTDPRVSYVYAAFDPVMTTLIARKMWSDYPHIKKIYPLDNAFAESMRKIMYSTDLYLDHELLDKMVTENGKKLSDIKRQIFSLVGYQFKINSNRDKADALSRFVTLTQKTKGGGYAVGDDILSEIDHPLAKLFQKYNELDKLRGTYLTKMQSFPQPFHINYTHCNAATGRMTSGGSRGNSFFAPFNIQNVPKVEIFRYLHRDPDSAISWRLDDEPKDYLGKDCAPSDAVPVGEKTLFKVTLPSGKTITCSPNTYYKDHDEWKPVNDLPHIAVKEDAFIVEDGTVVTCTDYTISAITPIKVKCKGGMRDLFTCPEGYVWLSADYCAEEQVLLANFARETALIEPLLQGLDIHKYVATKMFGHYDPTHRTIAKAIAFAANYGGTGFTIAKNLGVSQAEGDALLAKYNKTLSRATAWKEEQCKLGQRTGYVYTYFGRPRAVYPYFTSSEKGKWSFGKRTCMNSPIQGTGGDIIRLDHVKLFKWLQVPEVAENVKYALTVHDEINLFVRPNYLSQAYEGLTKIMNMQPANWAVPLKVAPSIGIDWGKQIDGSFEDGVFIPEAQPDFSLLENTNT